ncbi:MAG: PQQ-dependent sugar dehydrogenase [Thermoproteota archaeon]|nr:PQQ-dependent sugar dehydrogenase [Thermoproteota archaeon]
MSFSLLVLSSIMIIVEQQQQVLFSAQRFLRPQTVVSSAETEPSNNNAPVLKDNDLQVEQVTERLESPTSMAFIGNHGDMLVSEKKGEVIFFSNENNSKKSIFNFTNVDDRNERGLLGIAVMDNVQDIYISPPSNAMTATSNNNTTNHKTAINPTIATIDKSITDARPTGTISQPSTSASVLFYLTEASMENRTQVLGNRIYRFEWNYTEKSLSNGRLILDLPVLPGQNHDGGKLISDRENGYIYAVIGDLNRRGMLENFKNGSLPDDTSVILRINPDGSPAQGNPFLEISRTNSNYANLSKYYAYGIRNSFGLAIDPETGVLWDTENGPDGFDEINIVRPGFNSGWAMVMGPIGMSNVTAGEDLVNFDGSSYYDPVFSWGRTVGVTDIEFYESRTLGEEYTNNIFVADANNGDLYFFKLNEDRSGLQFESSGIADDLVASNERERTALIFGTGFPSSITDIETGPDGYLYVLTFHPTMGTISRIVPQEQ